MKEEYISKIIGELRKNGIIWEGTTTYTKALGYLPELNLSYLAEMDYSKYKDFEEVRNAWVSPTNYLKFTPYIISNPEEDDDNPSLCLNFDRFLHMFRGYYFQISGTHDGNGSHGITAIRTDSLMLLPLRTDYGVDLCKSKLIYMLLFAAMIDCGYQDENFRDAMESSPEVIDEFFKCCMEAWWMKFDYNYEVIKKSIHYTSGVLEPKNSADIIYQIKHEGRPICRFRVSDKRIEVEYAYTENPGEIVSSTIMYMDIPDVTEGIVDSNPFTKAAGSMGGEEPKVLDDVASAILRDDISSIFSDNAKPQHMILMMLLKFVGIHACWYTVYPIRKLQQIVEVLSANYVEVESCRDFIN